MAQSRVSGYTSAGIMTNKKSIEEIAKEDGRYSAEALKFVFEGLGATIRHIAQSEGEHSDPRHITGKEFSEGLGQLSLERWGRLGRMVLNRWGINTTRDFGEIVFLMIKNCYDIIIKVGLITTYLSCGS